MDTLTYEKELIQLGLRGQAATNAAHTFVLAMHDSLPVCTDVSDVSGSWLQIPLQTDMFDRKPVVLRPITPYGNGIGLSYFTDLAGLKWLPTHCRWMSAASTARKGCLMNQRVLFHGDSHMRTLYNHIAVTLCGIEAAAVKGFNDEICFNGSTNAVRWPACVGLRACFDPEVNGAASLSRIREHDVFVTNFGQHDCAGGRLLADYAARVSDYALLLAAELEQLAVNDTAGDRPKRVVWTDTMPLVVRTDHHIFSFRDKRTTPRLRLFNRVANAALKTLLGAHMQTRRFSVLEMFDMAQSVMEATPDDAHFIDYAPALDAMADMIMTTICT
jgi:hypothetical protein